MKHLIIFCFFTFAFCFLYSCGDDTLNNNPVTPPPTLQDSIVKLTFPDNNFHFVTGDTKYFTWKRNIYTAFRFYLDTSSQFSMNNYLLMTDTSLIFNDTVGTEIGQQYWKVVPYLRDTIRFEYSSEVRTFTVN